MSVREFIKRTASKLTLRASRSIKESWDGKWGVRCPANASCIALTVG